MKLTKLLRIRGSGKSLGVKKAFVVAIAAALALGVSAKVITIPENGTLVIGGTGADTNNKTSNFIVFEPGSTLVVTSINDTLSIWPTIIATNGAATVRLGENDKSRGPTFQYNVFACGNGSLTLEDMASGAIFGHADHHPIVDLGNLYKGSGVGAVTFAHGSSILAFPTNISWVFTSTVTATMRLYGRDMFPDDDVIELNRCTFMLCNPEAIPAGKTVRVNGNRFRISPLAIPDPADDIVGNIDGSGVGKTSVVAGGYTYNCNIELANNSTMTFTNSAPVTLNGSISGYNSQCGNIVLSGYKGKSAPVIFGGDNSGFTGGISAATDGTELVLSNANAAVNATIDMSRLIAVKGANGVSSIPIEAVSGGTDTKLRGVIAASNQSISVSSVSGKLRVCGAGANAGSAIDIGSLADGSVIYDDKTAVVTYGGSSVLPSGVVRGRTSGEPEFIVMQGGNPCFEAAKNVHTAVVDFDVTDGTQVTCGTNAVTVCAGAGVEATLVPAEGEVFSVAGAGSFAVESLLQRTVDWWFDFSRADTRYRIGEGSTDQYLDYEFAAGQPYVERVVDWRYPDRTNCLWNRRLYTGAGYQLATSTYPYVPADTQNGLQYISMQTHESSRRLPFSKNTGYNDQAITPFAAQLVVMVFGVNTGCYAMFGTTEGAFGRAGASMATYGMTTNDQHDVWLDGVKVDPTTTKFKSGFQVISVALGGLHFNGLGFWKDIGVSPNRMGGQNYGEVLIFTNAVSDQMRLEAEYYLARKWGLDSQYSSAAVAQLKELRVANPTRIVTAGCEATTIKAGEQAVALEGPFSGTVELDGGTLVVSNKPLPYAESEIPSEGRLYWVDPDDAETVMRLGDPFFSGSNAGVCSNEVRAIKDKSVRAFDDGQPILYTVGWRRPTPVRQARGLGRERVWLDFNEHADISGDGNCLRFVSYPGPTADFKNGSTAPLASMPIRTAFFVQDSIRGGGSPLLGDVNGSVAPYRRLLGEWTQTIWPSDKPTAFVNGEARINGMEVDYSKGFLGQPEVFAIRGTDQVNAPVIGSYHNSEKGAKNGEIIGEVLLYSTELTDDQVKGIEAYLMGKWIGRLPEGYADIRQATVAGTGTVQVAVGSQMPQIARTFEGEISVAAGGGSFNMTIDTDSGEVHGALDCPAATLSLPSSCTITLNFSRKPSSSMPSRDYTLVDCASGADGVAWTLNRGANAPSRGIFLNTGNKIMFRYLQPGMSVSFR